MDQMQGAEQRLMALSFLCYLDTAPLKVPHLWPCHPRPYTAYFLYTGPLNSLLYSSCSLYKVRTTFFTDEETEVQRPAKTTQPVGAWTVSTCTSAYMSYPLPQHAHPHRGNQQHAWLSLRKKAVFLLQGALHYTALLKHFLSFHLCLKR